VCRAQEAQADNVLCLCSAVDGRRSCSGGCRLPVGHTPEWRSAPGCSIRMHPGSVRAFQSRYHLEHRALTVSRHRMVPSRTELHPYQLFRLPAQGWIDTRRGLTGLTRGNERLVSTQYNLYCEELFISRPTHPRSLRTHQQPDRRKPKLRVRYLPSPTSIPTGWPPLDSIESALPEDLACIQGGTPDRNPGGGRVAS